MSHVAVIKVQIKDLEALKQTCSELGLEFVEGQKTYKWYGRWVRDYHGNDAAYKNGIDPKNYGKCDHAIRIPGNSSAYEVGVVRLDDGSYTLIWDFYNGGYGLIKKIGKDGEKLTVGYAKTAARNETKRMAKKFGYSWSEKQNEEGETVISMRKY